MTLSQKDQEILSKIFNPLTFPTLSIDIDTEIQTSANITNYPNEEIKTLELLAIKQAEADEPYLALETIKKAIEQCPEELRASLYNNKAQILRLIGGEANINAALELLDTAINISKTAKNNYILRLSSAQRAWIHFRAGKTEEAFKDFELAGKLGCGESRKMAVRCNPYAAMCNQFMQEILGSKFYSK